MRKFYGLSFSTICCCCGWLFWASSPLFGQSSMAVAPISEKLFSGKDELSILRTAVELSHENPEKALAVFEIAEKQALKKQNLPVLFNVQRERGYFFEERNELPKAFSEYLRAEETALKAASQADLLTIYTDLAILSRKMARYVDCRDFHQKALDLALRTGDNEIVEDSYHGLGYLHEQIGDYEKAVSFYLKSLDLTRARGGRDGEIVTLQNIGKVYMKLGQADLALQNIREAERMAIAGKNDSTLANVEHDFGEILVHFDSFSMALKKLNAALATYRKIDFKPFIASSLVYLGDVHQQMGRPEQTEGFFRQALDYEPFMDAYVRADLFFKLGQLRLSEKRTAEAVAFFEKSLQQSEKNEFKDLTQRNAEALYRLADEKGDASLALGFLEISTRLKDSIFSVEKTRRVAELQLKYEAERKERDIQAYRLRQNQMILGGIALFFALVIGFLAYIVRMSARNNALLESKNREIQRQNSQLTESNEVLRQYAYVAAHDLKEPLRTISSFVQLLEKKFGKNLDPEALTYMAFVTDSAKRMNGLLTDLLEYSSIFNQKPGKDAVSVAKVVEEIGFNLRGLLDQKGASIDAPDDLPSLQMSRVHLVQIFQNLVGNGLKFVPEDRQPLITITCKTDAREVIFAVRDNGVGIEERHREKIFNLFFRVEKTEAEGTGIGLSICKSIADKYGGRIWFQSVVGQGTTFFFSFPKSLLAKEIQPEIALARAS